MARILRAAINAFNEIVLLEHVLTIRRADQIEGWIQDTENPCVFIGTSDTKYPERRVSFFASNNKEDLALHDEEFGIGFYLIPDCDYTTPGKIEITNKDGTYTIISLNLLCRPKSSLNIPYIEELGYPLYRITPAFMLSLLNYLRSKMDLIPEDEKRLQIPTLERRLIESSVEMLLNSDLITNSAVDGLTKVGKYLPLEILSRTFKLDTLLTKP